MACTREYNSMGYIIDNRKYYQIYPHKPIYWVQFGVNITGYIHTHTLFFFWMNLIWSIFPLSWLGWCGCGCGCDGCAVFEESHGAGGHTLIQSRLHLLISVKSCHCIVKPCYCIVKSCYCIVKACYCIVKACYCIVKACYLIVKSCYVIVKSCYVIVKACYVIVKLC